MILQKKAPGCALHSGCEPTLKDGWISCGSPICLNLLKKCLLVFCCHNAAVCMQRWSEPPKHKEYEKLGEGRLVLQFSTSLSCKVQLRQIAEIQDDRNCKPQHAVCIYRTSQPTINFLSSFCQADELADCVKSSMVEITTGNPTKGPSNGKYPIYRSICDLP